MVTQTQGKCGLGRPWHENHDRALRRYDRWLKGIDNGVIGEAPVRIFVRGRTNPLEENHAVTKAVRRIVTGHDASGKAIVVSDAPAPNVKVRQAASGLISTLVWVTDETPADISSGADRADRTIRTSPPANGSVLRVVDFPPVDAAKAFDNDAMLREMGIGGHAEAHGGKTLRHPFMHRTRSIDYAIVLCGEIDMLLDDSEVHMKAGDIMVQQGTYHAWVNRGKETCRIAFVLIDALEPPQWHAGG